MVTIVVVSGTGTGVGKTVVTAAMCALALDRGVNIAVVKPAQTGAGSDEPGDLAEVRRLCGELRGARLTLVEGARFPHALSPAAAARVSKRPPVDLAAIAEQATALQERHRLVLVEGAGGLLVRYDEDGATIADLALSCGADVLVVTDPGLGALNATALTLEAMAHRGLELAGLVIGSLPEDAGLVCASNVADFEMLSARPLAGVMPAGAAALDAFSFAMTARESLAPALGGVFDAAVFRAEAAAALADAAPGAS